MLQENEEIISFYAGGKLPILFQSQKNLSSLNVH